jgi:hypothetical protein
MTTAQTSLKVPTLREQLLRIEEIKPILAAKCRLDRGRPADRPDQRLQLDWMAAELPEQGQQDIFGATPDARVAGVLNPSADVHKVDGGYEVSGQWPWASGSRHADWALVGILLPDEAGTIVDQWLAFTPMSELTIKETWFVAGMKGTGSNTMIAENVFVPEHRVHSVPRAIDNEYATEHTTEVLYRSSFVPVLTIILAGPQLGLGRAALRLVMEKAPERGIAYTRFEPRSTRRPSSCRSPTRPRSSTPPTCTSGGRPPTSTTPPPRARRCPTSAAPACGPTPPTRSPRSARPLTPC